MDMVCQSTARPDHLYTPRASIQPNEAGDGFRKISAWTPPPQMLPPESRSKMNFENDDVAFRFAKFKLNGLSRQIKRRRTTTPGSTDDKFGARPVTPIQSPPQIDKSIFMPPIMNEQIVARHRQKEPTTAECAEHTLNPTALSTHTVPRPKDLLTNLMIALRRAATTEPCDFSKIQDLLSIHANVETLDDLRQALVGHINDLYSALGDLLPLSFRNTQHYEKNNYTRTEELTRYLDLHGKNSTLMERFLEWLQNRGWVPKSAWSVVGDLFLKASSAFEEASNMASQLVGDASTVIEGVYEPDSDKYPPLPSPFSARVEIWTSICINGVVTLRKSIRYTFFPVTAQLYPITCEEGFELNPSIRPSFNGEAIDHPKITPKTSKQ